MNQAPYRMGLEMALLGLLALLWGASWLFVQSLFNATGAWLLLAWGQQYMSSGLASVLNSSSPLFVMTFSLLMTRTATFSPEKLAAVCVGFAGVVLVNLPAASASRAPTSPAKRG